MTETTAPSEELQEGVTAVTSWPFEVTRAVSCWLAPTSSEEPEAVTSTASGVAAVIAESEAQPEVHTATPRGRASRRLSRLPTVRRSDGEGRW